MNRIWDWIGRPPMGGDSPGMVARPQPRPIEVRLSSIRVGPVWVTALLRKWLFDDVPDCKLCSKGTCCAVGGECLFLVSENVSDKDAPLYSIANTPRQMSE